MKFLLALTFLILTSPSWASAEFFKMEDLVERNNLFYQKFNDVPISGEAIGLTTGILIEGKREGIWLWYHEHRRNIS